MSEKHPYEAVGLRPDGDSFAVEILGHLTEDEALALAQHYAALWNSTVHLYRVPFLNTTSTPWADDEMQFICRLEPSRRK
jgi:hypothetical protein